MFLTSIRGRLADLWNDKGPKSPKTAVTETFQMQIRDTQRLPGPRYLSPKTRGNYPVYEDLLHENARGP